MEAKLTRERAVETAGFILNFLKLEWPNKSDLEGRKGGYLSYGMDSLSAVIFTEKVRIVRYEKREKYVRLSSEKVTRLEKHPKHALSSESRNPDKNEWGGAVRGHKYLRGFSGLTEELDEIAMIGLALAHDDLSVQEVESLLAKHYPRLEKKFVKCFMGMAQTDFEYGHIL